MSSMGGDETVTLQSGDNEVKRFSEAFLQALPRNYNEICRGWVQPGPIDYY